MTRTLPVYTPAASQLIIDRETRTVRPACAEGDDYYGLGPHSYGTAAAGRRAVVEATEGTLQWVRANGHAATGITLVYSGETRTDDLWAPGQGE